MNDISLIQQRTMPQSIDAEQAILGGLMIDNGKFDIVAGLIAEGDFYREAHRKIYRAIHTLSIQMIPYDMVTLSEQMERDGTIDDVGGLYYLGTIANNVPTSANIKAYCNIVKSKAKHRKIIEVADGLLEGGFSEADDAADEAIKKLMALHTINKQYTYHIRDSLAQTVEEIDEAFSADTMTPGISFGLKDMDEKLGGMRDGHLIIVGGRPKMGKTAKILNFIDRCGVSVGFISAEQGHKQISMRMLSINGKINSQKLAIPKAMGDDDWPRLTAAAGRLQERAIYIYDKAAPTIDEVEREARRLKQNHDIKLLVVDYIQRLKCPGKERRNEVAEITQRLKEIARELEIPVVAGAQVSRKCEERSDKRPMCSDLKEAGELEQEADLILLLYRDEVYNQDSDDKGTCEINIAANRHGPTGIVKTVWLGEYMRFENAQTNYYAQ